jgi:hypothetical protein
MGCSPGFGSTRRDAIALFRLAVAVAPRVARLTLPRRVTRRFILQKARGQGTRPLPRFVSQRFQDLFHSPRRGAFHRSLTVLFAIGRWMYLALGRGRPGFRRDVACPAVLKIPGAEWGWSPTGLSPAMVASSKRLQLTAHLGNCVVGVTPDLQVLQPGDRNAVTLGTAAVWAAPGSLAATTGMVSVPRGT